MEQNSSFAGSVAINWIMQELEKTSPVPVEEGGDSCPRAQFLGIESDTGLRIRALRSQLARPARREEEGPLTDPRMRELARQVLEKLLLLERRMTLGPNAVGVDRFKVYPDGTVGSYAKSR